MLQNEYCHSGYRGDAVFEEPEGIGSLPAYASVCPVVGYRILKEHMGFMDRAETENVFHLRYHYRNA